MQSTFLVERERKEEQERLKLFKQHHKENIWERSKQTKVIQEKEQVPKQ